MVNMRFAGIACCLWLGCEIESAPEEATSSDVCVPEEAPLAFDAHPTVFLRPEHAALIREKIGREPFATIYDEIVERAAQEFVQVDLYRSSLAAGFLPQT